MDFYKQYPKKYINPLYIHYMVEGEIMAFEIIGNDLNVMSDTHPDPYHLEYYEKESLNEIKRCLKEGFYHDRHTIMDHIEFLDHLMLKLQSSIQMELSSGTSALEAKDDLAEVQSIKNKLLALANQFT